MAAEAQPIARRLLDLGELRRAQGASDRELGLLAEAAALLAGEAGRSERLSGHLPSWWEDGEVRRAVIALRGTVRLDTARARLLEKFGPKRAPSRSSIHRAWKALARRQGRDA